MNPLWCRRNVAKNNKNTLFSMFYTLITWILDQSECAHGPIYIIKWHACIWKYIIHSLQTFPCSHGLMTETTTKKTNFALVLNTYWNVQSTELRNAHHKVVNMEAISEQSSFFYDNCRYSRALNGQFSLSQSGDTHECIIYAMRKRARAVNLTIN